MNTFLPYSDFKKSAKCLDRLRLGKQRVEVLQLLKALNDQSKGWKNHPCTKIWQGYENALVLYGIEMCTEWKSRGYKDTCLEKISAYKDDPVRYPKWLGNVNFHKTHQSNLVRKDANHYRQYFPDVPDDLSYIWPTN